MTVCCLCQHAQSHSAGHPILEVHCWLSYHCLLRMCSSPSVYNHLYIIHMLFHHVLLSNSSHFPPLHISISKAVSWRQQLCSTAENYKTQFQCFQSRIIISFFAEFQKINLVIFGQPTICKVGNCGCYTIVLGTKHQPMGHQHDVILSLQDTSFEL